MLIKHYNYKKADDQQRAPEAWAKVETVAAYSSGRPERDILLSRDCSIAFHEGDKSWEHGINNNVFAFGGTGAGKTMGYIGPNIAQMLDCNYVIADPKGELADMFAESYRRAGYRVAVLDTIELAKSDGYDPLRYLTKEEDIPSLAKMLLDALSPARHTTVDAFWNEASEMALRATIGILWQLENIDGTFAPGGDPAAERKYLKVNRLCDLLELLPAQSDYDRTRTPLDRLIEGLEKGGLNDQLFEPTRSYAVQQYNGFRCGASTTVQSVLIELQSSLTKLTTEEMQHVFAHDDLQLDKIDEGKRFIVLKISDNDSSKSFLAKLCLKQLFNIAQRKADAQGGSLKRRLMFVLDEFPNLGRIDDFERAIATVRSRGINFLMAAQSISQLEGVYGQAAAQTILDNCDSILYMGGGSSLDTASYIASLCGESILGTDHVGVEDTEIDVRGSVITASEVGLLPRTDCIVKLSGCRPFKAKKNYLLDHANIDKFNIRRPQGAANTGKEERNGK